MEHNVIQEVRVSTYESLCEAFGKEEVDKHLNKARTEIVNKYFEAKEDLVSNGNMPHRNLDRKDYYGKLKAGEV